MRARRGWPAAALLAVLTFVAYIPALRAGFFWDDISIYVVENPLVHAPDGLYRFWFTHQPVDYYPLANSLFWIEWHLWGPHAAGYHAVGILLHALVALLVWRILLRLGAPGAWVAAALFAVHPVNVESAAWISQLKTTLSAGLFFGAFLCYLRFDAQGERRWYAAALGLFLLSLLAKTSSVTLPLVLLGHAGWRRGGISRRDLGRVLPFLGLVAAIGPVALSFQNRAMHAPSAEGLATRLAAAGWAVWFYIYKAILPVDLSFVYPRWRIDPASVVSYLPGAAFLVCLGFAWRYRSAWGRPVLAGLGWFAVTLLPVLGFFGIGFMRYTRVADHWQYTSIAGLVALLVGLVARRVTPRPVAAPSRQAGTARRRPDALARRGAAPRLATVVALGLVVLFAALTWRRAGVYANEETAWRDTLARNPGAWIAHNNLGKILIGQGHLDEARAHLEEAVRLEPSFAGAQQNLGNVLDEQGKMDEAMPHYSEALRLAPQDPDVHFNVAIVLAKQGRAAEAAGQYAAALELRPDDAEAHRNLADLLAGERKVAQAVEHYRAALRLQPADLAAATKLAWFLATSEDPRIQDGAEAVRLATQVCQATGFASPSALDALAAAYARTGRLQEAVDTASRAVSRANEVHRPDQAREIEVRLDSYRAALAPRTPR